jgi:chloride channel protein, CIC family
LNAAAVGAAFNTPLAGVILAIEVVLIEYTVGGFLRYLFGCESIFAVQLSDAAPRSSAV